MEWSRVFGRLKLDKSYKTKYFSIQKKGSEFVYKRGKTVIQVVGKKINLGILPLAPVNKPNKITNHFIIEFPEVYLPPEGVQILFLKIPIEVGIFINERLVDTFGFEKPEFSLYGPVSGGIIARQVKGERVDENHKCKIGYAILPLRIKNYNKRVRRTSKLLINTTYLNFYYDKKRVATEMVKLDIRGTTKVRNLNKNYFKGMNKVKAKTQLLKKEEQIDMRWGM